MHLKTWVSVSSGPGAVFGSSHAARGPRQEQDGLLTLVGVWSCFGLAVPLQPNIPAVLLRAICVVVVLLVLLQEVTLIVQCLLRQDNDKREEKKRRRRVCFKANLLILHMLTATGQRIVSRAEIRIYMTNHRRFDSSH